MKPSAFSFPVIYLILSLLFISCQKEKEEPVFSNKTESEEKANEEVRKQETKESDEYNTESETSGKNTFRGNKNNPGGYDRIKPSDAKEYVGKRVIVEGYVADVVVREKVAYLNLEKKYPNNPFTGVIFASDFEKFGDLDVYRGKTVTLKGKVSEYRGKPQIILNSPEQIK